MRDFEEKMNEAAERASGECVDILREAVMDMTVDDALGLFNTEDKRSMSRFMHNITIEPLTERCRPIIDQVLDDTNIPPLLDQITEGYNAVPRIPFVHYPDCPDFDVGEYVTRKCLAALFNELGNKEEEFRRDPWGHLSDAAEGVLDRFAEFVSGGD